MKKICVTGITGVLGANVVNKLLENGYSVIALVRKKSSYLGEENKNLRLIEGNLFYDISKYLVGVSYFVHIAAETSQNLLSYKEYIKTNYDATIHLFLLAVDSRVDRFLFVSSANTLGFGSLEKLGTENCLQKYPFTHSYYAKSKLETENYLLQNNQTTQVIILNPTFMIGKYDRKPSSGKIIFWAWKKKVVFYPKGGKSFVHAEDVANGILKAIEKGRNGEKYLLTNENLKYKRFFKQVNTVTNQNPLMIPIPDFLLIFLGFIGDILRKFKVKTNLSSTNMKALRIDNFYDNQKSIDELGMEYQPIKNAIEDAVCFFEERK